MHDVDTYPYWPCFSSWFFQVSEIRKSCGHWALVSSHHGGWHFRNTPYTSWSIVGCPPVNRKLRKSMNGLQLTAAARDNYQQSSLVLKRYGGFLKWGGPQVTMAFNTKSWSFMTWMIWGYFLGNPHIFAVAKQDISLGYPIPSWQIIVVPVV